MHIWHDIKEDRISKDEFDVLIEIPRGGNVKYELDKDTGLLRMDRILYTATHYPSNYGFIPRTYAQDEDPLDVLVLSSEEIVPLTLVRCYPIGVVVMKDNGYLDEKIIAVPYGEPTYTTYKSIEDLPPHKLSEIKHFFKVYKQLEGKETAVEYIETVDVAKDIIEKSIKTYNEIFVK